MENCMNTDPAPFLTAEWRHLAMVNYDIDPATLKPFVPEGTELDDWNGRTLASLVGFLFLDTRVLGIPIPFHRNFEEVNLRFYVRRRTAEGWRRGVVFVKEIVPRLAIALVARVLYGENYVALPMSHRLEGFLASGEPSRVRYGWRTRRTENWIRMEAGGDFFEAEEGGEAEFITEHYWGYAGRRGGGAVEYRVEHPRWRIRNAADCEVQCDAAALYGDRFRDLLQSPPASAFLAEGSEVTVFKGRRIAAGSRSHEGEVGG